MKTNEKEAAKEAVIENKEQFINDNIQFVPKLRMKYFKTLTIDEQYNHLENWKKVANMRQIWLEKNKIINRVIEIFDKRNATVEDAIEVKNWCEGYIRNYKQTQIDKLDEEIRKLQEKRLELEA